LNITIIKIGRIAYPEIRTLAAIYEKRLKGVIKIQQVDVKDDDAALKWLGGQGSSHLLYLLDERGKLFSSTELAQALREATDDPGIKSLVFVVAGPMGPSAPLRSLAARRWSLSRATFTSDMAWLLVWEQMYRAYSILKGTAYHHD
jgi:23S rRNA (pseudouridine1915-N3)-methyltransferase